MIKIATLQEAIDKNVQFKSLGKLGAPILFSPSVRQVLWW